MAHKSTILAAVVLGLIFVSFAAIDLVPPLVGCDVKGNISVDTRERIYHVQGQKYYPQAKVNLLRGERWFCSEDAARKAGWRKSSI
jgi:ATP sulfurylase